MFQVLGITDEITTCGCCGKRGLKRTVAMSRDGGEVVHYGTDCAGAALTGTKKSRKNGELAERLGRAVAFAREKLAAGVAREEVAFRISNAGLCGVWHNRRTGALELTSAVGAVVL